MKTFLVVAGLLMAGASVYGVVDYNRKAESKAFKDLYKENAVTDETTEPKAALPVTKNKVANVETTTTTEKPAIKKPAKKKIVKKKNDERVFRLKEFSRGKLE